MPDLEQATDGQSATSGRVHRGSVGLSVRPRPERTVNQGSQVVDRVVDILEAFVSVGPQLGVSEVSRALGLKKATAHRLLASLTRRGLIDQDPATHRYRLGVKLWALGSIATSQVDWVERVRPYVEHLTELSGETTHLAVLHDGQVLYVDKVESPRSLRMPSQVGMRLPAHCTGVGKMLLAYLPPQELWSIIDKRGLPRMTSNTITDPDALLRDLEATRERGYSVDNEEIEDGLRCIAGPVRDHLGQVVAAVSIAALSARLPPEDIERWAGVVMDTAGTISVVLGCPIELLDGRTTLGAKARSSSLARLSDEPASLPTEIRGARDAPKKERPSAILSARP